MAMKVETISRFRDKESNNALHEVGDTFECSDERGAYLVGLGFAKEVKDKAEQPKDEQPKAEPQAFNKANKNGRRK